MTSASLSHFSQEYIDYNDGPAMVTTCTVIGILSLAVVGLRLWARKMKAATFGPEDWLIIICVPLVIGTVICAICAVHYGRVGRHYDVNKIVDPASYGRSQAALFAVECIYGTLLVVVKFSILAMYWRIFPTKFVRRGCAVLGGMTLAWLIAIALVAFLQCDPIQKIWLPDTPGHCIDNNKFFVGNAVPNIFTDVCIVMLPAYEVSRLHMASSQKISLACVFLLGLFVSVISGIRLIFLFKLSAGGDDADLTVLITIPWILTVVEGECAVICACLPLLRPVVQLVFGRVLTNSRFSKSKSAKAPNALADFKSGNVTIGGGGRSRQGLRSSFARLDDTESSKDALVCGFGHEISSSGSGDKTSSERSADIPLEGITVRNDVKITWTTFESEINSH